MSDKKEKKDKKGEKDKKVEKVKKVEKDEEPEDSSCYGDTQNYARYYDSPDGCDLQTKIKVATRYGFVAGLIAGTYDVLMYSHVVGMGPIMKRYARHVVPLALMGATFATVSTLTLRARNIDDKLNYFLGGVACGPLVALYLRSGHGVVAGGIFLGLIGIIKKEAIDANYEILHKFPSHMNTITSWKSNTSIIADPRDAMLHTCEDDFDEVAKEEKKKEAKKKKQRVCHE